MIFQFAFCMFTRPGKHEGNQRAIPSGEVEHKPNAMEMHITEDTWRVPSVINWFLDKSIYPPVN